jgi:outer-membrane receptor for ferric coprogen and ferric-rhodotorulic acid
VGVNHGPFFAPSLILGSVNHHVGEHMRDLRKSRTSLLASVGMALLAPALMATPTAAHAQADDVRSYDIPSQSLAAALAAFSEQSRVQFSVDGSILAGKTSGTVRGRYTAAEALTRLLAGTGLNFRITGPSTVAIAAAESDDGEHVLGAVRVEGAQSSFGQLAGATAVNGINGSRDVTATEGTGSYTTGAMTIGGKTVATIKDTPQSVSVLSTQQMRDQAITNFDDAMKALPGVVATNNSNTLTSTYISRGLPIDRFQVDGGAAMQAGQPNNDRLSTNGYNAIIDMSIYDHIELLRGASGFNSYGVPGGTINLVRKRALDHNQFVVDASAGSWSNYRISLDATGPIALDGKLRARIVSTYQDTKHFYQLARDSRLVLFGTVDFDITPTTTITAGFEYTKQNSLPFQWGLPRYLSGADIDLPRSTCFCLPWNDFKFENRNPFINIEQKINQWTLKVKLNKPSQATSYVYAFNRGYIGSSNIGQLAGEHSVSSNTQTLGEVSLDGSFNLFGREQKMLFGANFSRSDPPEHVVYQNADLYQQILAGTVVDIQRPNFNVFNFNPYSTNFYQPAILNEVDQIEHRNYQQNIGFYADVDLNIIPKLHVLTGLRYSKYYSEYSRTMYCTLYNAALGQCGPTVQAGEPLIPYTGPNQPSQPRHQTPAKIVKGSAFAWPPKVTVRYDLNDNLTMYGAYTDIYVDQSDLHEADGTPIKPMTGYNLEGGFKYSPNNGKLNISASVYTNMRTGLYKWAFINGNFVYSNTNSSERREFSQGFDLESTGEILPGWQVSASLNFVEVKVRDNQPSPFPYSLFQTQFPKIVYKLWTSFDLTGRGVDGLSVNGGLVGQSSTFVSGRTCTAYSTTNIDPVIQDYSCISYAQFNFVEPSRVVFSAGASMKMGKNYTVQLNIDNVLNKKYYGTIGGISGGNYYGAPRSVMVSLRGKW